jgi:hypothetical protein
MSLLAWLRRRQLPPGSAGLAVNVQHASAHHGAQSSPQAPLDWLSAPAWVAAAAAAAAAVAVGVAVGAVAAVATFVQREEGCGENIGYARLASRHQRRASFVWSGAQERAEPWQAIGTLLSYCEQ